MRAINLACLTAAELARCFTAVHLKLRAEVVSAGGWRLGRRIFIAASQANGRRSGYRLWRRTAVATASPFMRRLIWYGIFFMRRKA